MNTYVARKCVTRWETGTTVAEQKNISCNGLWCAFFSGGSSRSRDAGCQIDSKSSRQMARSCRQRSTTSGATGEVARECCGAAADRQSAFSRQVAEKLFCTALYADCFACGYGTAFWSRRPGCVRRRRQTRLWRTTAADAVDAATLSDEIDRRWICAAKRERL